MDCTVELQQSTPAHVARDEPKQGMALTHQIHGTSSCFACDAFCALNTRAVSGCPTVQQ